MLLLIVISAVKEQAAFREREGSGEEVTLKPHSEEETAGEGECSRQGTALRGRSPGLDSLNQETQHYSSHLYLLKAFQILCSFLWIKKKKTNLFSS